MRHAFPFMRKMWFHFSNQIAVIELSKGCFRSFAQLARRQRLVIVLELSSCAELFNISFMAICSDSLLLLTCSVSSILFAEMPETSLLGSYLLFSNSSLFTQLISCFSLFSCADVFELSLLASESCLFSICISLSGTIELFTKFFLALVKTSDVSLESHRTCPVAYHFTQSRNFLN